MLRKLGLYSLVVPCRSVVRGNVSSMKNQRCHEVEFEDGSICDSIPETDMVFILINLAKLLVLHSLTC